MNIEQFFQTVLPNSGYRCIVQALEFGYSHHPMPTNLEAARRAKWLNSINKTVYFGCSSLKERHVIRPDRKGYDKKRYRIKDNLLAVKSFWLDLDVGNTEDKYPTRESATGHLYQFLMDTGLPTPLLVDSGYGAHVYFPLTKDINIDDWNKIANMLHSLVVGYGLRADKSRTRDAASILRPIGMTNRKNPDDLRKVAIVGSDYKITPPLEFAKLVSAAIKKYGFPLLEKRQAKSNVNYEDNLNDDLVGGIYNNTKASALPIADECAAMAKMRDSRGCIQEPLWYALIGVLNHTEEGSTVIHEWSNGYPGYSVEETDDKIQQRESMGMGPTSCAYIQGDTEATELCNNCPHFGLITSPIQLGNQVAKQEVVVPIQEAVENIEEPFPARDVGMFEVTPNGVIFKDSFDPGHKVEEENKVRVLEYPLIIKSSAEDERKGGVLEVEYLHPTKGRSSFHMEKAVLAEKSVFYKELLRNHITLSTGKVDLMKDYMISYLQDLDRTAELQMLYTTMGWKEDTGFVLGSRYLRKDKEIQDANLGMHLAGNYCNSIKEVGDYKIWSEATKLLDSPGLEKHAIALLFGFGAPLMRMTGYDGAIINLLGQTNAGKSTMLEWITSIFGDYRELKAQKSDTYNSLMGRLGTLNNLPMVIDEITNIDFKDVSDLIYSISQGREKTRMTQKITDMKPRSWNTLVICSSNASLGDKLLSAKADPEAERMRMIEYWMAESPAFMSVAAQIHGAIKSNYGGVGTVFMQYVLNNYAAVHVMRSNVQKMIEEKAETLGKERFWVAAFSSAVTGGLIAHKLGLIQFDMTHITNKIIELIKNMRGDVVEDKIDYTSVLGRYLNAHSNNVIFVRYGTQRNAKVVEAVYEPQRELLIRVEHDQIGKRVFVDKQHLIRWLNKSSISTSEFVQRTKASGLMINLNNSKVLGKDWSNNPNNAAVPTMEFYLKDGSEEAKAMDNNVLALAK